MLGVHTEETLLKHFTSTFPDERRETETYTTESSEYERPDSPDVRQREGREENGEIDKWKEIRHHFGSGMLLS